MKHQKEREVVASRFASFVLYWWQRKKKRIHAHMAELDTHIDFYSNQTQRAKFAFLFSVKKYTDTTRSSWFSTQDKKTNDKQQKHSFSVSLIGTATILLTHRLVVRGRFVERLLWSGAFVCTGRWSSCVAWLSSSSVLVHTGSTFGVRKRTFQFLLNRETQSMISTPPSTNNWFPRENDIRFERGWRTAQVTDHNLNVRANLVGDQTGFLLRNEQRKDTDQ